MEEDDQGAEAKSPSNGRRGSEEQEKWAMEGRSWRITMSSLFGSSPYRSPLARESDRIRSSAGNPSYHLSSGRLLTFSSVPIGTGERLGGGGGRGSRHVGEVRSLTLPLLGRDPNSPFDC